MVVVKRNSRQYREFDHQDAFFSVSGWKNEVTVEVNSGTGSKIAIECTVEQARALLSALSETIARLDDRKEKGADEAA